MKLQISEILNKLSEFKGDGAVAKKIEWLQKNDSPTLRLILQHSFDPNIAYNLPEGDPPFRKNDSPIEMTESTLFAETRKLSYLWLVPSVSALKNLTKTQQDQLAPLQKIQEERGTILRDAQAAFKAAEQEINDAREAIEAAKVRYHRALDAAKIAQVAVQDAQRSASEIDMRVTKLQTDMLKANAELDSRLTPPPTQKVNIPKYRLEMLFIQLLESLHKDEADVLLAAKNKTLNKKYAVTKDIVKKAFPNLLS